MNSHCVCLQSVLAFYYPFYPFLTHFFPPGIYEHIKQQSRVILFATFPYYK